MHTISSNTETRITTSALLNQSPSISGNYVTWTAIPNILAPKLRNGVSIDYNLYNITTGDTLTFDSGIHELFTNNSQTDGVHVVYTKLNTSTFKHEIYLYNIINNSSINISNDSANDDMNPDVHGDVVTWQKGIPGDIYMYSISAGGTPKQVTATPTIYEMAPSTDGMQIVWLESSEIFTAPLLRPIQALSTLMQYTISNEQTQTLKSLDFPVFSSPKISNGNILLPAGAMVAAPSYRRIALSNLYVYNIASDTLRQISTDAFSADIDEENIVWTDTKTGMIGKNFVTNTDGSKLINVSTNVSHLDNFQYVDPASVGANPAEFPCGMVSFEIVASEANVTVTCEGANTNNAKYMKYGPTTPGGSPDELYDFSDYASRSGNTWTLYLKDNQIGDDSIDANLIVDAGGPLGSTPVPLSNTTKVLLVVLFGFAAFFGIRRKRLA